MSEPLPSSYFLGCAYNGPEIEFLAMTVPARADGDTAAWLAWLPSELRRPQECRMLLAAGLPREDVVTLLETGAQPEWLEALAAEAGLAQDVVARLVGAWSRAGCVLDAGHLGVLTAHGLQAHTPSSVALDHLEEAAAVHGDPPSRTELGVVQALVGGRGAAAMAAPFEEISQLDLAAVATAEGGHAAEYRPRRDRQSK